MRRITNHDLIRMRELAAMGNTVRKIAEELGCATATVRYWAGREGITIRRERQPLDQADLDSVQDLAALGLSRHEIARRTGMSPSRVRWTAKRCAIPLAHGRTGRPPKARPAPAPAAEASI